MYSKISGFILKMLGWEIETIDFKIPSKAVMVMAPHTSNWDFVYGKLGMSKVGIKNVKFLIKKEAFYFPIGPLLKAIGGMPVDRSRSISIIAQVVKMFRNNENFILVITPEGTRNYNEKWKKGYYSISKEAGVPLIICYLDYKKKKGGIGLIIEDISSLEYVDVLNTIRDFYKGANARFPENFDLSPSYLNQNSEE